MRALWQRVGRISSLLVVSALLAVAVAVGQLMDAPAAGSIGAGLFGLFLVYLFARPSHRLEVFAWGGVPGGVGGLAHELLGVSRYLGARLGPVDAAAASPDRS